MSNMKKFYVTTPIYYVNDRPHIGHAYTTLVADVFARYYRQMIGADNVFFLTGTDEHGAKIAQAAKKNGLEPQEFVDKVSEQYQQTWGKLDITYDYFFRTTHPDHTRIVQELLQKIYDKGYIYKAQYKGLYCIGCEKYVTENEIVNGRCPDHPTTELTQQEEENYFFKLKELAPQVLAKLEGGEFSVLPDSRRTEIISKIQHGINDISISRTGVEWGIPLPWDDSHTIYVWIDALFNYLTATKIVEGKESFWPANLHLMAKDILWFHALIWEALLIVLDEKLPTVVFAHGFFTIDGQKMSKSLGNVIDPLDLAAKYGTDGLRYLLISSFSFGNDGDFSVAQFDEKFNADLANGIGNLVSRIAKLCENSGHDFTAVARTANLVMDEEIVAAMKNFRPDEALRFIRDMVQEFDKQIHEDAPWKLQDAQLIEKLELYVPRMLHLSHILTAFLPDTSARMSEIFTSGKIVKPAPLFERK